MIFPKGGSHHICRHYIARAAIKNITRPKVFANACRPMLSRVSIYTLALDMQAGTPDQLVL